MAKKKNVHLDRRQAKAKKQKKLAIVLCGVLGLVLVLEVPKTLKMMNPHPAPPVVNSSASAAPAANPTAPASTPSSSSTLPPPVAAPSIGASSLVNAVQVQADPGQLTQFAHFASKDPFNDAIQPVAGGSSSPASSAAPKKKTSTSTASKTPPAPPAPPPTSAVISVNGELMRVQVNTDFPLSGTVFSEAGALFHLVSLTQKSAKVAISGGTYADGAPSLNLVMGTPVTLQNTADGTRYTLLLESQETQIPTSTTAGTTTPTSTTPSVIPSTP
ncbi:MAG: hypothetical protein ACRDNM_04205 [Gaiellaceae bacterium]